VTFRGSRKGYAQRLDNLVLEPLAQSLPSEDTMKLDEKDRWDGAFERAQAFERAERLEARRELHERQRGEGEEDTSDPDDDLDTGMHRLWQQIRRHLH
jgi:hypothetical protein